MKVLSIVVDEIPSYCSVCKMAHWSTDGKRMFSFCVALNEMINLIEYPTLRPPKCPLVLEPEVQKLKDHQCAFSPKCGFRDWSEKK